MNCLPETGFLRSLDCPKTASELFQAIGSSPVVAATQEFERLDEAIDYSKGFLDSTLPFLWNFVRSNEAHPLTLGLLADEGEIRLTQRECLAILGNAFFCAYTDRPSDNCLSGPGLPSINFDELYGGDGWGSVEVAKLRMLLSYFSQMCERTAAGDALDRMIVIRRQRGDAAAETDWTSCPIELTPPVVHPLGESIDDAMGMLRVDFANEIIGGGALAYGCVQEEIMFCEFPELIVSRLYCPVMKTEEAILMLGAEQFTQHSGYGGSLRYEGRFRDQSPIKDNRLQSAIVAMDAIDLRNVPESRQFEVDSVLRDLTKAWAAFSGEDTPNCVATGNWGCGAFGGDAELKSLLQWMACSRAGKTMHYFPYDHHALHRALPQVAQVLLDQNTTVGELASRLLDGFAAPGVFDEILSP